MSIILGIDPGTTHSGYAFYCSDTNRVLTSGDLDNDVIAAMLKAEDQDVAVCEMLQYMGMGVGKEVFNTCVWVGEFRRICKDRGTEWVEIYRSTARSYICGSARAKDSNMTQALLSRIGPKGVKKDPGPTYGVKGHAWQALAVAYTWHLQQLDAERKASQRS